MYNTYFFLQKIKELEDEAESQQKVVEVLQYKEKVNKDTEAQYRDEIDRLRQQLDSSHLGRTAESQLFLEKAREVKSANDVRQVVQVTITWFCVDICG